MMAFPLYTLWRKYARLFDAVCGKKEGKRERELDGLYSRSTMVWRGWIRLKRKKQKAVASFSNDTSLLRLLSDFFFFYFLNDG